MKKHVKGFTLIELLVVIAVIGILASIVLVSVNSARNKANATRVQTEITQIRLQLEGNFNNDAYGDLVGTVTHADTLSLSGAGVPNIVLTACDIGKLNNYPSTVTDDLVVDCDAGTGLHSGVVIYSIQTGTSVKNYGVYATTTPGGYVCLDSYGNTVSTTTGSIPAYGGIASPATALCQ